jgi:hypothetical protein
LKPILSRFCEIYISEPEYNGQTINLYKWNIEQTYKLTNVVTHRNEWLKKELNKIVKPKISENNLLVFVTKLYEKAYNSLDIITLLEEDSFSVSKEKKYELLIAFNKVRKEFRNEQLLLLFVINFIFLDNDITLENISFM